MRFLVDECTGPKTASWLLAQGHEVFSVFDEARGTDDDTIIQKAFDGEEMIQRSPCFIAYETQGY